MNKIQTLNGNFTSLRDEVIATIKSMSKEVSFSFSMTKYNLEDEEILYNVDNGEITEVRSIEEEDFITIEYKDICLDDLVFIMEKCAEILEIRLEESEDDLFDFPELIPESIGEIMESANDNEDSYEQCNRMQNLMKPLGYTFEYGLDGVPYNLRKISKEEREKDLQEEAKELLDETEINMSLDKKKRVQKVELYNKISIHLKNLKESHLELMKLWTENNNELDNTLSFQYPYNKSFDELYHDVASWQENFQEIVNLHNNRKIN